MPDKSLLELPFDQYSRQMQVASVLNQLRKKQEKFKILDIGGYKGATTLINKDDNVIILDVFDVKEQGYIKGDGTKLPFENDSVDFAFAFDVLEHVPIDSRQRFVNEMSRVAKRGIAVAVPVNNDENNLAEDYLLKLYSQLHHTEHVWLKEHRLFSIPTAEETLGYIRQNKLRLLSSTSNDTDLWFLMQGLIFIRSKYSELSKIVDKLNVFYNKRGPFDGGLLSSASYRLIAFGFKSESDYKSTENWLKHVKTHINSTEKLDIESAIIHSLKEFAEAITDENNKLSERLLGYEHSTILLNNTIHRLQVKEAELETIKKSKAYRIAKHASGAKRLIRK